MSRMNTRSPGRGARATSPSAFCTPRARPGPVDGRAGRLPAPPGTRCARRRLRASSPPPGPCTAVSSWKASRVLRLAAQADTITRWLCSAPPRCAPRPRHGDEPRTAATHDGARRARSREAPPTSDTPTPRRRAHDGQEQGGHVPERLRLLHRRPAPAVFQVLRRAGTRSAACRTVRPSPPRSARGAAGASPPRSIRWPGPRLDLRCRRCPGLSGPRRLDATSWRPFSGGVKRAAVFAVFAYRPFERQRALRAPGILHVGDHLGIVDLEVGRRP